MVINVSMKNRHWAQRETEDPAKETVSTRSAVRTGDQDLFPCPLPRGWCGRSGSRVNEEVGKGFYTADQKGYVCCAAGRQGHERENMELGQVGQCPGTAFQGLNPGAPADFMAS